MSYYPSSLNIHTNSHLIYLFLSPFSRWSETKVHGIRRDIEHSNMYVGTYESSYG